MSIHSFIYLIHVIHVREVKAATMKSLEVAERRRSELEKKASSVAARLTERDSEVRRTSRGDVSV